MPPSISLRQLADHVGLSPATVSLALNGKGRISGATRERVREAAKKLGYQPSAAMSAAMRSAGSRGRQAFRETIGCVSVLENLESFEGPQAASLAERHPREITFLNAIRDHARHMGCAVDFFSLRDAPTERLIKILRARRIERLIIIPAQSQRGLKGLEEIEKLTREFPCVFLSTPPGAWLQNQSVVELDDYSAGKLVFLEAIKAGYQKLLLSSVVSALKLDGRFLSGLHHCRQRIGMDVEIRVAESREDEEEQLRQALDDPTPTCFIGGRESLEPWLDEIGKKVPQLGLLDLNARRPDKALDVSGIDQCREEQARAAMELCLATPQPSAGARRDGRLVLIEPQWVSGRSLPNQERRHHALGRCRLFPDADHTTYAPLPLPSKSLRAHKAIARQALLHYPLPPLQPGKTYYHGIPFHIASSPREGEPRLLLIGADQYGNAFQRSSTIAVNRCVSSLYFLWAAGFCQAGRKLGALRVSFEDGSTSHHPIQPRKTTDLTLTPEEGDDEDSNMQDWWPQAPPLRNRHTHPVRLFHILRQTEHFGYYYVHRWENPHPGKVISRVRIQAETGASAFILLCGVTAGTLRSSK